MNRQKLIIISDKTVTQIIDGDYGDFIKSMVKLGATMLHEAEDITSIQGPFKNTEDDSLLLVVNIKGDDHVRT